MNAGRSTIAKGSSMGMTWRRLGGYGTNTVMVYGITHVGILVRL
jgi:hypothetical protein